MTLRPAGSSLRQCLQRLAALCLLPLGLSAQAQGVETLVTNAAIVDFEFDWGRDGLNCPTCNQGAGNARLAWTDGRLNLWVANVDYATGAFVPASGRGVKVDTNTALVTTYGNGPEWAFSALGSQLVYTKYLPDQPPSDATAGIGVATLVNGLWTPEMLDDSLQRISPIATLDQSNPAAMVQYQDVTKTQTFWRLMADGTVEHPIAVQGYSAGARRWVPGTGKVILTGKAPSGYNQVFLFDTDSGQAQQLTNENGNVSGAMMWQAPEYNNEYVFFAVLNGKMLVVYRQLPDASGLPAWQVIQRSTLPTGFPYVWSPEYFVHNGRSYIFFQMNKTSIASNMSKPSQIGMVGILPDNSTLVNLTPDTTTSRVRMDPEYYITAQGPFIYYNRYQLATSDTGPVPDGVWRVDTQLGPPVIGSSLSR
ncbi:hypothetical protein [Ideonella oryzae]|uniref:Uncharacterized protein n=1 Tax=Ideonella oryzae TaxID=2937441 RepID=A0ABT1BPM4_9BURK|nr:hypothetical protein [Ideonella oryzae]MCO5978167.1 hypothetical protein [Ideonella oryzae]